MGGSGRRGLAMFLAGRGRRAPARSRIRGIGAAALAAAPTFLLGAAPAPDLAVPRDGMRRDGTRVHVIVENRGTAAAPATVLELRDRPALGGTVARSSPYPFTPNRTGVWIFQEPAGKDAVCLDIGIGSGGAGEATAGEIRFVGTSRLVVEEGGAGAERRDGSTVEWTAPPPGGARLRFLAGVPAKDVAHALVTLRLTPEQKPLVIVAPEGERVTGSLDIALDAHRHEAARTRTVEVPALAPDERREITADFPAGTPDEVLAWVDPDDAIAEVREGNNVSVWRPDRDRVTRTALHLHSSFSEGAGSVDWQVLMAARSGYDLLWWSEHEWRIACRDHVTDLEFRPEEELEIDDYGTVAPATVDPAAPEGEDGRALRLAVPSGKSAAAVATLTAARKRMTYSLTAEVTIAVRLLARDLDADDRFTILADLSQHPGEKRRIGWVLRWDGLPEDARDRDDAVRRAVPSTIPTGSWITVELPLSRDALEAWANGLDDNLQELRFTLESGGSGASVLVDRIEFRHDSCGERLRAIQESWMPDYPNVAHLFAEEVSYSRPHLNQYGGSRGLFDGEAIWGEERAADVVERVRSAGGVVSWCHPLGVFPSERVRERFGPTYRDSLVARRFGDAAILEVGYRRRGGSRLAEYLELWDDASRRGVVLTGIGVNDSHEQDWASWENNFATWLEAPADDPTRLLEALRTGRAFFGDPLAFRGRVSIECGGARAGDVMIGSASREVIVRLVDAPPGARVRLVVDGAEPREWTSRDGSGEWRARLRAGEAPFVRGEVWSADGDPLAFTNPIWFDTSGRVRRP